MATLKIEIIAGAQTYTNTKTVTVAHLVRWIAALRVRFNMTGAETDAQVADAFFATVFAQAIEDTRAVEKQKAADTAIGAVAPIGFT